MMYDFLPIQLTQTASTPLHAHSCNCIGCCRRCGTCRTWHGHTPEYCDMIVRHQAEQHKLLYES